MLKFDEWKQVASDNRFVWKDSLEHDMLFDWETERNTLLSEITRLKQYQIIMNTAISGNPYRLIENQQEILYSCLYQYMESIQDNPHDVLDDQWTDDFESNKKLVQQEQKDIIELFKKLCPGKANRIIIDSNKEWFNMLRSK